MFKVVALESSLEFPTPFYFINSARSETWQIDFVFGLSAEPTGITVLKTWYIHPQSGYEIVLPFDGPYPLPGGDFMGIRCEADEAVTVGVNLEGEE